MPFWKREVKRPTQRNCLEVHYSKTIIPPWNCKDFVVYMIEIPPLKYFGKSCVFLEKALDISHLLIYNGKAVQEHMLL